MRGLQAVGFVDDEQLDVRAFGRGGEELRMGAAREPADVEKAMRRIEDEAARMGVLVEDRLTLARLDEVAAAPHVRVDLGSIVRDAVDDGRATAPNARSTLGSTGLRRCSATPIRRQVLGNLLRNALVHTPPGTPIDVSVAHENGDVRLEVRDHGPGLPRGDPPRSSSGSGARRASASAARAAPGLGWRSSTLTAGTWRRPTRRAARRASSCGSRPPRAGPVARSARTARARGRRSARRSCRRRASARRCPRPRTRSAPRPRCSARRPAGRWRSWG
jgi:hypothetical protein